MEIDFDRLRSDILDYLDGAFFVGGFGACLVERTKAEYCSDEELLQIAFRLGFDISNYQKTNGRRK